MRALTILTLATFMVLASAGCGNSRALVQDMNAIHSSGLATPTPATTTTAPTSNKPESTPRGNIKKNVGEVAATCVNPSCEEFAATFTLDKIEVDPKCTDKYAARLGVKPEKGHFLALSFTVKTTAKFTGELATFAINPFDFSIVGPDGITETNSPSASSYGCLADSERLPSNSYAPSSQYVGKILIDTKHSSGILIFRPFMDGGWEWQF